MFYLEIYIEAVFKNRKKSKGLIHRRFQMVVTFGRKTGRANGAFSDLVIFNFFFFFLIYLFLFFWLCWVFVAA